MKKIIKIIYISILCISLLSTFCFASTTPLDTAVEVLTKMKIVIGDENGNLMLDKNFTRAEFATVITRLLSLENTKTPETKIKFTDVSSSFWGYSNIYKCVNEGYLVGDGNGLFRPNDPIKYEEVLTIMIRILNKEVSNMSWPDDYISKSETIGLTKNTNISKGNKMTRANSFILIYNSLNINL